jgi:hypothetical protein
VYGFDTCPFTVLVRKFWRCLTGSATSSSAKHHWLAGNVYEFFGHPAAKNLWLTAERVIYSRHLGMDACVLGVVEGLVFSQRMCRLRIRP